MKKIHFHSDHDHQIGPPTNHQLVRFPDEVSWGTWLIISNPQWRKKYCHYHQIGPPAPGENDWGFSRREGDCACHGAFGRCVSNKIIKTIMIMVMIIKAKVVMIMTMVVMIMTMTFMIVTQEENSLTWSQMRSSNWLRDRLVMDMMVMVMLMLMVMLNFCLFFINILVQNFNEITNGWFPFSVPRFHASGLIPNRFASIKILSDRQLIKINGPFHRNHHYNHHNHHFPKLKKLSCNPIT